MEEGSIIFKKSLCVTSLSSGTPRSSSKEPLNRFEGRRHQSTVKKRPFISGFHSAQTLTAQDALLACHIYKCMLKKKAQSQISIGCCRGAQCVYFLMMINLPERRASSKVCQENKDFWEQTNLEPDSRGSQHRSRNRGFSLCLYQKTSFKNTHDKAK